MCELDEDAWAVVVERELYGAVLDAAESGGVDAVLAVLVPFGVTAEMCPVNVYEGEGLDLLCWRVDVMGPPWCGHAGTRCGVETP